MEIAVGIADKNLVRNNLVAIFATNMRVRHERVRVIYCMTAHRHAV